MNETATATAKTSEPSEDLDRSLGKRSKLKVVQLGVFPPPHGGVQTNVAAIHERLQAHGHDSFVINLTGNRQTGIQNVFFPRTAADVCKLLVSLRPNVTHLHIGGDITPRLIALAAFTRLFPGRKTVCTLHSGGYPASVATKPSPRLKAIRRVFRRFNALVAVNQELRTFWEQSGIGSAKVHLIEPFPHLTRSSVAVPLQPQVNTFCETHSPLLVTVGLLEPEYDLSLQIRVLRRVRRLYPAAGLVIVGSGSLERSLKEEIAAEPAGENILLAGDQPHASSIELIRRASVFLRTTHYDGDSISVREALQLRTPVVATDTGMRPAHVVLASLRDEDSVTKQILTVLNGPRSNYVVPIGNASEGDGIDGILNLYQSLFTRVRMTKAMRKSTAQG
jgi:glycosyltransferase involved in cell wall biosynthesis